MKILIPGLSGGIARRLALRLWKAGHEVAGIDARAWPDRPESIELFVADLRKRAAEEAFRRVRPEVVIHMATVSSLVQMHTEERTKINLLGTQAVFEHCRAYGVRQVVFVGRHTFYGAAHDAPLYHTEDEPPRALDTFPELADLVAADLYAATALWRAPELSTAVLRVCYALGPSRSGTLASFLAGRRVPRVLGHDPLFQFMHDDDVARAIELSVTQGLRGIFNVAGPPPLPLSVIIRETGRTQVPLPEPVLARLIGRAGLPRIPKGALQHIKYPVVVDAQAFAKATGFVAEHSEVETLRLFRRAVPPP